MVTMNRDELSFIRSPPDEIEIECPICLQVMLDDPHLVSCCGHHFCCSCIKKVKDTNKPCPLCKEKNFQVFCDKSRLRYINGLRIACTNKPKGCKWEGELKSLSSHINRKKREGECQFELAVCRYDKCAVKQTRQYLKIHEEEKCNQRPYQCNYCQSNGTYQYITGRHYDTCTQYPIPCSNRCQYNKIPRNNIKVHLSSECPLQPVECEYKWAGCLHTPLRKDVSLHNTKAQSTHISLLTRVVDELKKENSKLKEESQKMKKETEQSKKESFIDLLAPLIYIISIR